jgi:hypothetical protein
MCIHVCTLKKHACMVRCDSRIYTCAPSLCMCMQARAHTNTHTHAHTQMHACQQLCTCILHIHIYVQHTGRMAQNHHNKHIPVYNLIYMPICLDKVVKSEQSRLQHGEQGKLMPPYHVHIYDNIQAGRPKTTTTNTRSCV